MISQYYALPLGLKIASYVFIHMVKLVVKAVCSHGIHLPHYFNDWLNLHVILAFWAITDPVAVPTGYPPWDGHQLGQVEV